MLVVDLIIVALIIWAGWVGYARGFILVAIELTGLLLAALVASLFYRPVANLLTAHIRLIPSFAGVIAYASLLLLTELASLGLGHWLLGYLPPHVNLSRHNRIGGTFLNAIKAILLTAVALVIFNGLPLAASTKDFVNHAHLPRVVNHYTGGLQRSANRILGSSIADTLDFFTVKPESEESINLHFHTTNARVDEASESRMLALVNNERTSRGLKALTLNTKAREVARAHSVDMFAHGYFSHITPEGKDPFQRMDEGGVHFAAAGENLALAPTLDLAHQGLMNSPGHRANILSTDFNTVGIGVIDGGPYGLMITQDFTD